MRGRDEECPGPWTTHVWLLTSDDDYSRDHWECAIIRCLGPGDCQHPSPVARLTNGLTHGITIFP